jgi:hypothetical protein
VSSCLVFLTRLIDTNAGHRYSTRFQNQWHEGAIDASGMSVAGAIKGYAQLPRVVSIASTKSSSPTGSPTTRTGTLPDPSTFPAPASHPRPSTKSVDVEKEKRMTRSRRGTLHDNVPLDKAAAMVGSVKRMATQTAVGMVGML